MIHLTKVCTARLLYLQSFQSLKLVIPLWLSSEMTVIPGLPVIITRLPSRGLETARTHCTPLKTNQIPHRGHHGRVPEGNSMPVPCPGFSSRLRGQLERTLRQIPTPSVEVSEEGCNLLSCVGKVLSRGEGELEGWQGQKTGVILELSCKFLKERRGIVSPRVCPGS